MNRWAIALAASAVLVAGCNDDSSGSGSRQPPSDTAVVPGEWGWTGGGGSTSTDPAMVPGEWGGSGGGTPPPGGGGGTPPPPPPTGGSGEDPFVDPAGATPYGVTWYVGFNQNVPMTDMTTYYGGMNTALADLWQVSEGQVYVTKVKLWDNVGPTKKASDIFNFSWLAPGYDVIVFEDTDWDLSGVGGFVIYAPGAGRADRVVALPKSAGALTKEHEYSHFVFKLSWSAGPGLTDEYAASPQDSGCIMELTWSPLRWCSGGALPSQNHQAQSSQPQSCWEQILADYPNWSYTGANTTSAAQPTTTAEYTDAP